MYLNLIKELSHDNKYTKWYINIITTGKQRVSESNRRQTQRKIATTLLGYVESHHIVPKCLTDKVGISDVNNNVFLTAKEHFICHLLLVKMLKNKEHISKMLYALNRLSNKFKNNSATYSRLKICFREMYSDFQKELWSDPAYREKQSLARAKSYADPVRQEANSQNSKQYFIDNPEQCIRVVDVFKEAHKRLGTNFSSKEWTDRSFHSDIARAKAKETHQTDEHRAACRQRELSKGKEALSNQGKLRRARQTELAGGQEVLSKLHSEKIKGRVKIINIETGEFKMVKNPDFNILIGWTLNSKNK